MSSLRVLIVEDEPDLLDALAGMLELESVEVCRARDGEEATSTIACREFDVVVSDMRMPRMDGVELLEWIQEHKPSLPVIIVSGFSDVPHDELTKAGAASVLEKPVRFNALLEEIRRVAGTRKA